MNKRTTFKIFTLLFLPLIAILAAEGLLALFGYKSTYEHEDPFLGFQDVQPLYEINSESDSTKKQTFFTRQSKRAWFNRQEFLVNKPPHGYRIFCFGGSTTFGRPYDYRTSFTNWLQLILQALNPSKHFEVINAGGVSYASYRIVNLMKEMIRYEPDLFIVYSGHNEFLEERAYSEILHESPFVTQLRIGLNHLRAYSLARDLWLKAREGTLEQAQNKFQMNGEVKAILDQSHGLDRYHRDLQQEEAIYNHFRFNLEEMIEIASSHGIRIIFVVPPSNEKDFSPFKSELSSSLTLNQKAQWQQLYQTGRIELEKENYQKALHAFQQAAQIDSNHADLHFRVAKCLLALARREEARQEFQLAMQLDVAPLRANAEIQQIVREVAQKNKIATVDLNAILKSKNQKELGHAILGNEFFLDHAHPTIAVHRLLAEELVEVMLDLQLVETEKQKEQINLNVLYDSVMTTIDSAYYAIRDLNLAKVLDWTGKKEEAVPFIRSAAASLPDHPEAQYMLGLVYQSEGKLELAAQTYQKALAIDSTYAKAHIGLGTIYDKRDSVDQALNAFALAIRYSPENAHAYFNYGSALYRKQRWQQAIIALKKAVELDPNHSKAFNNLGGAYLTAGALHKAIPFLQRTIELDPQNFNAYSNLGMVYFQLGEKKKAEEMFQRVLALKPQDDFAQQWLNRLNAQVN